MSEAELQAEVDQLKEQQAMLTEALRRTIEGKWTGADGTAALIVALIPSAARDEHALACFDVVERIFGVLIRNRVRTLGAHRSA